MQKKTYLIMYTFILLVLTIFNHSHALYNMLIAFIIIILQYVLDRTRVQTIKKSK